MGIGINRGWDELTLGADVTLPKIYKPILKYVSPVILLMVFIGALVTPKDNDWKKAFSEEWELDNGSILAKITNNDIDVNKTFFADHKEFEQTDGIVTSIEVGKKGKQTITFSDTVRVYENAYGQVKSAKTRRKKRF